MTDQGGCVAKPKGDSDRGSLAMQQKQEGPSDKQKTGLAVRRMEAAALFSMLKGRVSSKQPLNYLYSQSTAEARA